MAEIENLSPTTELEAVNAMLRAIGESPISAFGSGLAEEDLAVELLKEALREICTRRWRFNTEFNYAISSTGTDSSGNPIFEVPSGLASWRLSLIEDQRGLDIVAREERDGEPSDGAWLFADRLNGTDGIAALSGSDLLINPVWIPDFEACPQSVRSAVTIGAARRLQAQAVGGDEGSSFGFSEADEQRAATLLFQDQREAIPVPPLTTSPATELEALNQILQAADENPVIAINAIGTEEQYHGLQILRDANREVQSVGWKFNLEHSFELEPFDTYDWTDSQGIETELNLFEPPSDMLDFNPTPGVSQNLDFSIRQSVRYTPQQQVFYDRELNRDGFDSSLVEFLYIDIVRLIPFDDVPEVARQYILMLAARRFLQTRKLETNALPWTERDVRMAEKTLMKRQSQKRRRNIFDHGDAFEALGRRRVRRYRLTRGTNSH
jgi:hypothetical protein